MIIENVPTLTVGEDVEFATIHCGGNSGSTVDALTAVAVGTIANVNTMLGSFAFFLVRRKRSCSSSHDPARSIS